MNTNQGIANESVRIVPDSWIASSHRLIVGIEKAKRELAAEHKFELPERLFRVALNEAEALAWETEYPQLVFPSLAEEKIEAISAWYGHGEPLHSNYAMAV
jgi:hypothetical protein